MSDWEVVEDALLVSSKRDPAFLALARLREREAQNDDVHQGWIDRTNRAEARVAELEEALLGVSTRKDGDGLPCWCDGTEVGRSGLFANGHADFCLIARSALAHKEETP